MPAAFEMTVRDPIQFGPKVILEKLTFPSPVRSSDPERNDVVSARLFRTATPEPALVVPAHDVAMRIDEPGQRGHALRIDDPATLRGGGASRDGHDTAVPNDDGSAVDRRTGTDDDAGVGDDEILRRCG